MSGRLLSVLVVVALAAAPLGAETQSFTPSIPDVPVLTQDGKNIRFYTDLVKGKAVAVNFIYTDCKTICPMLGGMFANLQKESARGVRMISVSIDPTTDTPRRLKQWSAKFKPGPDWTFVTGRQADVDQILKAFGAYTARPQDHLPITVIGSDSTGVWTRNYGFLSGQELTAIVKRVTDGGARVTAAGRNYFTDVELTNQNGRRMRLYSDLIAGKTVVINSFYSTCAGICPVMGATFKRVQAALGDRLGRDAVLISITVDPETDTPARLHDYAKSMGAKPGWYFVTGNKESVDAALAKLGMRVDAKESHSSVMIIGNEPKGLWKKAFGMASSDDIVKMVEEVVAAK